MTLKLFLTDRKVVIWIPPAYLRPLEKFIMFSVENFLTGCPVIPYSKRPKQKRVKFDDIFIGTDLSSGHTLDAGFRLSYSWSYWHTDGSLSTGAAFINMD